ncbi:hypothetical protein EON81_17815 [bacterium]|nr:MAG: hypothetical protein EON81_17815 [bacterium]
MIPGLQRSDLASGARYLKLHHFADPEKDSDWLERIRREMSDTPYEFRREILMEDVRAKGAIWKRDWFHRFGFRFPPCLRKRGGQIVAEVPEEIVKIVVALDPSVTDPETARDPNRPPDETGIVAAGVSAAGQGFILADISAVLAPAEWSKKTVRLARILGATEIAYEKNQGGDLVRDTLQQYLNHFPELGTEPIRLVAVHAFQGKRVRAEPVAALYEQGRMHHCGPMDHLESQMTGWDATDPNAPSPGGIDATGIAMHALRLAEFRAVSVHRRVTTRRLE